MSEDFYPPRVSEPEIRARYFSITGKGAANPTLNFGRGITVTWVSTGLYQLTCADFQGTFCGLFDEGYQATTMSALKGYSVVAGAPSISSTYLLTLQFSVTNASDALADLQALQTISFVLVSKEAERAL